MSINGRICNSYQPRYLNGQASWFFTGPPPPWDVKSPPPWHAKCLKEMVILLGVLCRNGPIKRFLSENLISLTWSCQPLKDSWPRSFLLLLISLLRRTRRSKLPWATCQLTSIICTVGIEAPCSCTIPAYCRLPQIVVNSYSSPLDVPLVQAAPLSLPWQSFTITGALTFSPQLEEYCDCYHQKSHQPWVQVQFQELGSINNEQSCTLSVDKHRKYMLKKNKHI